jgi:hypothetical protein
LLSVLIAGVAAWGASAALRVCQDRVAHLTRIGYSRTPARTASLSRSDLVRLVVIVAAIGGDQLVEALEERLGLGLGLALDHLGHQRGRGHRDGAAAALEGGVLDDAVLQREVDGDLVAAERVVAARLAVRVLGRAEVPRLAVMVEDDLLVEVAQLGHQPKISFTLARPSASASISSNRL